MKGVILAAGASTRLRPLTNHLPKCLLEVGEKPILGRTLECLLANGITEVVIVTGYRESQIRKYVSDRFPRLAVTWLTNQQYDSTNNIYSLWLTRESVLDNDILLLDSDIVFDSRIIGLLLTSGHENCLAVTTGKPLGHEEIKVRVAGDGSIVEISKEVVPGKALGESIGIEKFSRPFVRTLFRVLDRKIVTEKNVNQFYEAAFQEVIDGGHSLVAVDVGELSCTEIDTPDDLETARMMIDTRGKGSR